MALVLDTGALIAIERRDRTMTAFLRNARLTGLPVRTSSAAVAQAWRDGSRQVRLVLALRGMREEAVDRPAARRIGELLAASGSADVVDASIVDIALPGDEILTSDPDDIHRLVAAAGVRVTVTTIH